MVMANEDQHQVEHINNLIGSIPKKTCTLCRYVLFFAILLLLGVVLFMILVQAKFPSKNMPIPPEKAPRVNLETWNSRISDLGELVHPELASTSSSQR